MNLRTFQVQPQLLVGTAMGFLPASFPRWNVNHIWFAALVSFCKYTFIRFRYKFTITKHLSMTKSNSCTTYLDNVSACIFSLKHIFSFISYGDVWFNLRIRCHFILNNSSNTLENEIRLNIFCHDVEIKYLKIQKISNAEIRCLIRIFEMSYSGV